MASKQRSSAVPVKAEDIASHPVLAGDESEIPVSIRASVAKPKKTLQLGARRATPYSTSSRRGPPASEASASRPSRRQAQVTSDVAWFNIQAANCEQPFRPQAWQSDGPNNTSYQSSHPVERLPQPPLIPGYEFLNVSYPEATQDFPQCESSTNIDPDLFCFQENISECKSTNTPFSTSLISDFSFEDEALQALFAATQASGGINHLQAQFDPTLLCESDDCDGPATIPQTEPFDKAPFDTGNEYDRFYSSWITGDYSYLEPTVADDLFTEPTVDWTPCLEDLLKHDLTAGYAQNPFSRCPSPPSVWA